MASPQFHAIPLCSSKTTQQRVGVNSSQARSLHRRGYPNFGVYSRESNPRLCRGLSLSSPTVTLTSCDTRIFLSRGACVSIFFFFLQAMTYTATLHWKHNTDRAGPPACHHPRYVVRNAARFRVLIIHSFSFPDNVGLYVYVYPPCSFSPLVDGALFSRSEQSRPSIPNSSNAPWLHSRAWAGRSILPASSRRSWISSPGPQLDI
jgi:hypothetical protein